MSKPNLKPCWFCAGEDLTTFEKLTPDGVYLFVRCENSKCYCEIRYDRWQHPLLNVIQSQVCLVCESQEDEDA